MNLKYCFTGDVYIVWDGSEILAMLDKSLNIKMCRDLKKLVEVREELQKLILETCFERRQKMSIPLYVVVIVCLGITVASIACIFANR